MVGSRSGPIRSEASRSAILAATVELLGERGYDHLTIEGIAARAGVGKQTIYRWWPSRGALVAECLLDGTLMPGSLTLPDTGDIRRDLTEWLGAVSALLQTPTGEGLLRSLIAAAAEHAEVGRRLREALTGSESVAGRLDRARGTTSNLRHDTDADAMAETLIGAVIVRALSREPIGAEDAAQLLAVILGPST